ncbi:hypothetical protein D3C87_54930 [compost metagenome]
MEAGETAFLLDLADLARTDVRDLISTSEEEKLNSWLEAQTGIATFFLDSFDELKLSKGSFKLALTRLSKAVEDQLHRVRLVVTTRPIAYDEETVREIFPIPARLDDFNYDDYSFAELAMTDEYAETKEKSKGQEDEWRRVALMPLSNEQILEFTRQQKIKNPEKLLSELDRRNAWDFARRPQDLIELCSDWNQFSKIRTHNEQISNDIRIKIKPRTDREEPASLSVDKAFDGVQKLALATALTRRLTIKHGISTSTSEDVPSIDPSVILSDWSQEEIMALLERSIFIFATYNRVRFHHRSVTEYLAAQRLLELHNKGMAFRSIRNILFANTNGKTIVRPSQRAVAAWLSLTNSSIFELVNQIDPTVLLYEGDPESLTPSQRSKVLRSYVEQNRLGGWRGHTIPRIQVLRIAHACLESTVNDIWKLRIENPEVKILLLNIIEEGRLAACGDIAYQAALGSAESHIRLYAIEALIALEDQRLVDMADSMVDPSEQWPDNVLHPAAVHMFPKYISPLQITKILKRFTPQKRVFGDAVWMLSNKIRTTDIPNDILLDLRNGLVDLIKEEMSWRDDIPHIFSPRRHLSHLLASVCIKGLLPRPDDAWIYACCIALKTQDRNQTKDSPSSLLVERISSLPIDLRSNFMWISDSITQSLKVELDPWKRFINIFMFETCFEVKANLDSEWVLRELAEKTLSFNDRAFLLEIAIRFAPNEESFSSHLEGLLLFIEDEPKLIQIIEDRLRPNPNDQLQKEWAERERLSKKKRERKRAKDLGSWIDFARDLKQSPNAAFENKKSKNTVWNLWRVMSKGSSDILAGWNPYLIEKYFGSEIVRDLRLAMMMYWRTVTPRLASESTPENRNTYFLNWRTGLAGVYAEADNPLWAQNLSVEEASLATRYAFVQLNGFPHWLEALFNAHPATVHKILTNELAWELSHIEAGHTASICLNKILQSSAKVAEQFIPSLESWIIQPAAQESQLVLREVIDVLIKHGNDESRRILLAHAKKILAVSISSPDISVWLECLARLDFEAGIDALEHIANRITPSKDSVMVTFLANVYGDHLSRINLRDTNVLPMQLLRLYRLAYEHVAPMHDNVHEGSYSPNTRDHAERARNEIVNAILASKGADGMAVKIEMASDPRSAHFKDRILAIADENWAAEVDDDIYEDSQVVTFNEQGEVSPSTSYSMFVLMKDRLSDLDELLLSDVSPKEVWAKVKLEYQFRRLIARELEIRAYGFYKIDMEAVTANEKETDIRMRSTISDHQAVIELKVADERSGRDLRDTIRNQLVERYMKPSTSRAGCLLVTVSKDRKWEHPETKELLDFNGLRKFLDEEAKAVEAELLGSIHIYTHLLDLRILD